jgi:heme/copper-type cytochrome/quinol oxidase subunit 1
MPLVFGRLMQLKLEGPPRRAAATRGSPAMELLNALLDLVDVISTALGWVAFWYVWVAPPRRQTLPSAPPSSRDELARFLQKAASAPSPTARPEAAIPAARGVTR